MHGAVCSQASRELSLAYSTPPLGSLKVTLQVGCLLGSMFCNKLVVCQETEDQQHGGWSVCSGSSLLLLRAPFLSSLPDPQLPPSHPPSLFVYSTKVWNLKPRFLNWSPNCTDKRSLISLELCLLICERGSGVLTPMNTVMTNSAHELGIFWQEKPMGAIWENH